MQIVTIMDLGWHQCVEGFLRCCYIVDLSNQQEDHLAREKPPPVISVFSCGAEEPSKSRVTLEKKANCSVF